MVIGQFERSMDELLHPFIHCTNVHVSQLHVLYVQMYMFHSYMYVQMYMFHTYMYVQMYMFHSYMYVQNYKCTC